MDQEGTPEISDRESFVPPAPGSAYGPSILLSSEESDSVQLLSLPAPAPSDTSAPTKTLSVANLSAKSRLGALTLKASTVGIVCALPLELLGARNLFDVRHTDDNGIAIGEFNFFHAGADLTKDGFLESSGGCVNCVHYSK
ncbi:uncharacterized protein BDV17DRAFT_291263 [Aspergillus undulatus]|uniref:uncharacterized protein n=1 Tax=Aspergillus undulatus TaxID=1810928 RepID=UPI003CCD2160